MAKVDPIPKDYPRVIPYLSVDGAAAAIDFYRDIFGAKERVRMSGPDGKVGHAEIEIGDSVIMLAARSRAPACQRQAARRHAGVHDDLRRGRRRREMKAGAKEIRAVEDQFYGDRSAQFEDPFGHHWNIASHVEDVPPEEMEKRAAAAMG
jgi:PhnB protein